MFGFFRRKCLHESLALSVILAVSVTLHGSWLANLVMTRYMPAREALAIFPSIGPVVGLYALSIAIFLIVFGLSVLWFRGKDCSHFRDGIFWFFVVAVAAFLILTIPYLFEFVILGQYTVG